MCWGIKASERSPYDEWDSMEKYSHFLNTWVGKLQGKFLLISRDYQRNYMLEPLGDNLLSTVWLVFFPFLAHFPYSLLVFPGIISTKQRQNHCFMSAMGGLQKFPSSSPLPVPKTFQCDLTTHLISPMGAFGQWDAAECSVPVLKLGFKKPVHFYSLLLSLAIRTCSEDKRIGAKPNHTSSDDLVSPGPHWGPRSGRGFSQH